MAPVGIEKVQETLQLTTLASSGGSTPQHRGGVGTKSPPTTTWLVFFSPARLTEVAPLLKQHCRAITDGHDETSPHRATVRLLAIGPTTAAAMAAVGLPCDTVCEAPTPEGVVRALATAGVN